MGAPLAGPGAHHRRRDHRRRRQARSHRDDPRRRGHPGWRANCSGPAGDGGRASSRRRRRSAGTTACPLQPLRPSRTSSPPCAGDPERRAARGAHRGVPRGNTAWQPEGSADGKTMKKILLLSQRPWRPRPRAPPYQVRRREGRHAHRRHAAGRLRQRADVRGQPLRARCCASIEPTLTPEQVKARADAERRRSEAEQGRRRAEAQGRGAALHVRVENARFDMARDRNIEPIKSRIKLAGAHRGRSTSA